MLTAWRICKRKHIATAFTGDGAKLFGGRWNNKGTAVVYTAGSASLAVLEMLVHVASHQLLDAYCLSPVTFDDALVETVPLADLVANWQSDPAPPELRQRGDDWIAAQSSAILCVPSAMIPTESNYLLNPAHPRFSAIQVGPPQRFEFDPRLVK